MRLLGGDNLKWEGINAAYNNLFNKSMSAAISKFNSIKLSIYFFCTALKKRRECDERKRIALLS